MGKLHKIIYRVDDRFIHGQVIEGWIKYYRIPNIILVSDFIAADEYQRFIYESIMPLGSKLFVMNVGDFIHYDFGKLLLKGDALVIVGSIEDLYKIESRITAVDYVNIGCLACGVRRIEVSDTVYIDTDECGMLRFISSSHNIFVHKLPWEHPVNIKDIIDSVCGDS